MFPRSYTVRSPVRPAGRSVKSGMLLSSVCLLRRWSRTSRCWGICRGIQFFNACLGGTLYQDLPTEYPLEVAHVMRPPYDQTVHSVALLPGTPLAALLDRAELGVNSYHHQAIKALAPSLAEMARSEDGLVEAVYLPDKSFVWAVQWHPEFSFRTDENSRKIFSAFVAAASGSKD